MSQWYARIPEHVQYLHECQKLIDVSIMCMCVFKFFFEITEPTVVHVGLTQDRGENLFKRFRSVVVLYFNFVSPRGAGAFSGGFTTDLARQCRAFSRALKIEKLKAPLFRGPEGAGAEDWFANCVKPSLNKDITYLLTTYLLQMTGAQLVECNWCGSLIRL